MKPIFVACLLVLLLGCSQEADGTPLEMETFVNSRYGYTVKVPKSWGAIEPFGDRFQDDLYFDLERIGPRLAPAEQDDRHFIDIEVFNWSNTARNRGESWVDFYSRLRLDAAPYEVYYHQGEQPRTMVIISGRTCWLMEANATLYVFCFDAGNALHNDIVRSVRFTGRTGQPPQG